MTKKFVKKKHSRYFQYLNYSDFFITRKTFTDKTRTFQLFIFEYFMNLIMCIFLVALKLSKSFILNRVNHMFYLYFSL